MTVNFQQIAYGGTYLGYAFGKEGVELVYSKGLILDNETAPDITDEGIMDQIKLFQASMGKHPKNAIFSAEISPTKEESKGWTNEDFRNIALELLTEMDNQDVVGKNGKVLTKRTTLMNSMCAIVKHVDSEAGIIHLHAMISAVDLDGHAIPQHKIADRAVAACDVVNARHHWKQPKVIRAEHLAEINDDIDWELRTMKEWDWNVFKSRMERYGYDIKEKRDSKGKVVSYKLYRGHSEFKASELGTDNCYTAAHLEKTWQTLHQPTKIQEQPPSSFDLTPLQHTTVKRSSYDEASYSCNEETCVSRKIIVNGKPQTFSISQGVYDVFDKECQAPKDNKKADHDDMINAAVLLFLGYIDAATTYIESHGGGNAPTDDWGRKRDDDDNWQFAHRCAKAVTSRMKPKVHRGLHR